DFGDETVGSAGIYLAPGATLDAVSAKLANLRGVQLRSSAALRELSLAVFDRTFVVTRVLEALTIVVAFIGVLSALMALQLERSRELGLLRALGVTRSRVASTVFIQTGTMGLTAGLFAIPIGLGVGVFLVQVVNRRAFGWSMGFEWSSTLALQVLVLAVFAAVLAGIYPALRLALTAPADALRAQ
ncbi:MAG: ABC transporter permease, partial [Chromatiales bacterium]|nr:ABC transporter permease [Chromatiales bacterium]